MKVIAIKILVDLTVLLILWFAYKLPLPQFVFILPFMLATHFLGMNKTMLGFFDAIEVIKLLVVTFSIFIVHLIYLNGLDNNLLNTYSLAFILLLGVRLFFYVLRNLHLLTGKSIPYKNNKAIIVGGGEATSIFLTRRISAQYNILGIFDDNLLKKGRNIAGSKILGTVDELIGFIEKHPIDQIIYMIPSVNIDKHRLVFNYIQKNYPKIDFLSAPSLNDINAGLRSLTELSNDNFLLHNVDIIDTKINPDKLKKLKGKTVIVTGGAGSIGKSLVENLFELVENITIVVIDKDELASYYLSELLQPYYDKKKLIIHLGDYGDRSNISGILRKYNPEYVYHAGAYKHVNLLESDNVYSAVHNNCIKAIRLAKEIKRHPSVKYFVLVSTDKAVNPSNIMGLTKRIVEISLNKLFECTSVSFITVRFGNVIGSNGSVFHKFLRQIKSNQKITLTHPSVSRFFMNINQAATLTIKASVEGESGKVYILNMGKSVIIYEFLISMIEKYGSKDQESDIIITGLKPGEKIKEELFFDHEKIKEFDGSMFEGDLKKIDLDIDKFEVFFKNLKDTTNEKVIRTMLKKIKIY